MKGLCCLALLLCLYGATAFPINEWTFNTYNTVHLSPSVSLTQGTIVYKLLVGNGFSIALSGYWTVNKAPLPDASVFLYGGIWAYFATSPPPLDIGVLQIQFPQPSIQCTSSDPLLCVYYRDITSFIEGSYPVNKVNDNTNTTWMNMVSSNNVDEGLLWDLDIAVYKASTFDPVPSPCPASSPGPPGPPG